MVTARDFAQTLGLLELYGIPHTVIGRHGGARSGGKVDRAGPAVARADPLRTRHAGIGQAVSHGSNDLAVAARLLQGSTARCSTTSRAPPTMHRINFRLADKVMVPEVIPWPALQALGLDDDAIGRTRASRSRSRWPTSSPTRRSSRRSGLDADPARSRCSGRRPP